METLQIQEIGSVAINNFSIDDELDRKFKPGLYLQVKNFLDNELIYFCNIEEQQLLIDEFYMKISNY